MTQTKHLGLSAHVTWNNVEIYAMKHEPNIRIKEYSYIQSQILRNGLQ
jgi:hypothetical protein